MAHMIDMSNDRANIAFVGSRNDIWHRLGTQKQPNASIDSWAADAGLNWTAIKVPAIASLEGPAFDHLDPAKRFRVVENANHVVRNDTGAPLGYVTDMWQPVQPRALLDWFDRYISVDDHFALDVAGSLKGGATIWATAVYRNPLQIAGESHIARILMTTTFDASGATINQGTMTRVVCRNTLRMALADNRCVIKTRHNTRFDPARVGKELAAIAQGFACYKAMGDAMAMTEFAEREVSNLFKTVLDIPFDAKREDISTRKLNQFDQLRSSYSTTVSEGAPRNTCWAALNAITRYVDHSRDVRGNGVSEDEKRFTSAQFGSGDAIKGKAMEILLPRIKDKVLIPA